MHTHALPLQTRVIYEDRPGVIVARCKPVGEPWRYDIMLDRENRVALLVPESQFVTERELVS